MLWFTIENGARKATAIYIFTYPANVSANMKIELQMYFLCLWLVTNACSFDKKTEGEVANHNIELAKAAFSAFNEHDWVKQASYFSDTCRFLDPSYGTEYKLVNRAQKVVKYSGMQITSPDIRDDISSIFAAGDKVVVQFVSSGTARTPEGSYQWSLPICSVFTFQDGLIVRCETYYNRGN